MAENVKIVFEGKTYEYPLVIGSEGEKAIDISKLRQMTGLITLDPGYANTGSCTSTITFMDGEKGILRYRGIPVEQLAEHSSFIETAYLLINGVLPNWNAVKALGGAAHERSDATVGRFTVPRPQRMCRRHKDRGQPIQQRSPEVPAPALVHAPGAVRSWLPCVGHRLQLRRCARGHSGGGCHRLLVGV